MGGHKMSSRRQPGSRRGALLICVLIILGVIALIAAQGVRTLMTLHRADDYRSRTVQAREVLELGKATLEYQLSNGEIDAAAAREKMQWTIELSESRSGVVEAQLLKQVSSGDSSEEAVIRYHVTARFPSNEASEIVVSENIEWSRK